MKNKIINRIIVILPYFLFLLFGGISYFIFKTHYTGLKHVDGTEIKDYESWVVAAGFGIIGFFIGKLIYYAINGDENFNSGSSRYFDDIGGGSGIM